MSKINFFLFFFILFSLTLTIDIPIRNSTYSLQNDCFTDKKKSKSVEIAQDCTDYKPNRKFQCCFVYLYDTDSSYCMLAKKNNKTDLNELKGFVSTKSAYAVVTCSQNNINLNNMLILLFFILFI